MDNYRDLFESRISAGAKGKLLYSGKLGADISSWSYDVEGHAKNVWSDIASWRTKHTSNCTKLQLHGLQTINSKKKNRDPWENCPKCALKVY